MGTGVEGMTKTCGRGNVPIVKSVGSRKRVERDERDVCELVVEDLEVGAQLVPLELRDVGLDALVQRGEPGGRHRLHSPGTPGCSCA